MAHTPKTINDLRNMFLVVVGVLLCYICVMCVEVSSFVAASEYFYANVTLVC